MQDSVSSSAPADSGVAADTAASAPDQAVAVSAAAPPPSSAVKDAFEEALSAAEARIAPEQPVSPPAAEKAPEQASSAPDGATDATPGEPSGDGGAAEKAPTTSPQADDPQAESTVAPAHWSAGDRAAFERLPQEARELFLTQHKRVQAEFTRATQNISEIKKQAEVARHWGDRLQQDPRSAILELAQHYGVELPNAAASEEPPPDISSVDELVRWADQRVAKEVQRRFASEQQARTQEQARQDARRKLTGELQAAAQRNPALDKRRDEVLRVVADHGVSVEQAWDLLEAQSLREQVRQLSSAADELKVLRAKEEERAKRVTRLPGGHPGANGAGRPDAAPLSVYEQALVAAERRMREA